MVEKQQKVIAKKAEKSRYKQENLKIKNTVKKLKEFQEICFMNGKSTMSPNIF